MILNQNDVVNGMFEFVGGVLSFWNCRTILQHREVKGISLYVSGYFTAWGIWNVYFYPSLNLPFSFCGAMVITAANIIWLTLALFFKLRKK